MRRANFAVLVATIAALGAANLASAGPLEDAVAAYKRADYPMALRLWGPLAKQGNPEAQHNLALMYDQGKGVTQNPTEAVKWYRLAAEQGDAAAQIDLGVMYHNGRGVPQNYAEAVKWYRLAAEQGYNSAQYNLGIMYDQGRGVPQNYVLAHMWVNLAGAGGLERAPSLRDRIASKMTPAQIAEAQRLADAWRPK